MIKSALIAIALLGCFATLAVFAWKAALSMGKDGTKIYKMAPQVIVVLAIVGIGVAGLTLLATGALKTDLNLSF